jgi:hypothetical protein
MIRWECFPERPRGMRIDQANSTELGVHQGLHRTRGDSCLREGQCPFPRPPSAQQRPVPPPTLCYQAGSGLTSELRHVSEAALFYSAAYTPPCPRRCRGSSDRCGNESTGPAASAASASSNSTFERRRVKQPISSCRNTARRVNPWRDGFGESTLETTATTYLRALGRTRSMARWPFYVENHPSPG